MSRRPVLAGALALLVAGCAQPVAGPLAAPASPGAAAPAAPLVPAANPDVGGATLPMDQTLANNVAAAPPLSTFARLLATAGLTDALGAPGPFTLFAPSDTAFGRLQPGTVEALAKSENRAALIKLLDLHRVAGALTGIELMRRIQAGGGHATLASLAGEPLTATMTGGIVTLTDAGGDRSYVEIADVRAANGVLHVVNGVLVPRLP